MFRRAFSTVAIPRQVVPRRIVKDMFANYVTWQNAITIAVSATAVNQFMTKSQIDSVRSDVTGLKRDVGGLRDEFRNMSSKLDAVLEERRGRWF